MVQPPPGPSADSAALRLALAQQAARMGYWDYDMATGALIWDEACARLFGIDLADFEGTLAGFDRRCHPDDVDGVHAVLTTARVGEVVEITYRAVLPGGEERTMLSRGQALASPHGEVERLVGVVLDVTDLRTAIEGERRAAERLSGLATVALALAGAQSDDDLTRAVIEHGVRVLGADGGAVCVRDDARGVLTLAMSDSLGSQVQLEYGELPLDGPLPGSYTARTGEPVYLSDRAAGLAFTPEMQAVYEGTGRQAWAVLPLWSADRLLGSLVVSWRDPRTFNDDDRDLLAAFAAQTAQALARIQSLQADRRRAQEARRLAEMLQRSLLTSPPQPEDVRVAVRYAPAAEEAAIGGDWYDAFSVADGGLCLVIGDCVGHDRQAAAAMATMRNLLRATAYAVEEPPAAVLRALDRAMAGLDVEILATALLARIDPCGVAGDGSTRTGHRLTFSNAGHLPPMVRYPDGTVVALESAPDLLLGFSADHDRHNISVDLPPGSTVLLFTDGLVERRREDLAHGLRLLQDLLRDRGDLPLEQLCDEVLSTFLDTAAEDDVALLAVRTEFATVALNGTAVERTTTLAPEPTSVPSARRFVTDLLQATGTQRWADTATLAVSEVVTNGVLHAHTPLTLSAVVTPDQLLVEVRDLSPDLPTPHQYGTHATTGRGMALVAAVANAHGVRPLGGGGKVVWFTVGDIVEPPAAVPDLEAFAALGGWPDESEDAGEASGSMLVQLSGMSPTLWLAAARHHDALLRELALYRSGRGERTSDLAVADAARRAINEAVSQAVAQARAEGRVSRPLPANHPAPLESVPPTVDLVLRATREDGAGYAVLQDVLDEAEALAAKARLLVRPGLPEIVAIRDWACEQVIAQLAGTAASAWSGAAADRFTAREPLVAPAALGWESSLVADSDRGAVAADDANRIVAVSRVLADALGWRVQDLVGRRVVTLVPPRYREAHVAGFTRHLTTGEAHALGVDLDLPVLRADGSEVVCSFFIEQTNAAGGRTVYVAWITPKP